jgi:alpha-1,3-mannosyltransferase
MVDSLRVLHITKRFWPLPGGVERYVLDLGAQQARAGHRVRVLTIDHDILSPGSDRLPAHDAHAGLEIFRVKAVGNSRKQLLAERPDRVLGFLRWADVIHHHEPRFLLETTVFARVVLRTPIVFHSHGMILHTPAFQRLKQAVMRLYYAPLLRYGVDAVVAGSAADAAMLEAYCGLGEGSRMRLYKEGIDLTRSASIVRRPDPGRVVCIGRIDLHKGHRRLIDALAKVPGDWSLDIAGGGPAELVESLRQHASGLGLAGRVRFLGRVTDEQLDDLLGTATVVAFPSEYEGFGLALVEAIAAGALVVVSDIPPHRSILGPDLADRLADFSTTQATERLEEALTMDPQRVREVESVARSRAGHFSVDRLATEIEGLYRELSLG